jgi:hypothetical protein
MKKKAAGRSKSIKKVDKKHAYIQLDENGLAIKEKVDKFERVDVDLDDATFIGLALEAHKRDITFNQLCSEIIENKIKELEKKEKTNDK